MDEYLLVLEKALEQPVGLAAMCISTEAADTLKRKLYEARAKARDQGDHRFDLLSMSISPHSGEVLYIYKREENEEP